MSGSFMKMHGLGNDFVILDCRDGQSPPPAASLPAIADRRRGVGCDQVIVLLPASATGADVYMRIYNPDGSEAGACGNGTRCVAAYIGKSSSRIETVSGVLDCTLGDDGIVTVDMGVPRFGWDDIPLREERDTLHLGIGDGDTLHDPVAVSMGNPHCVFFVGDVEKMPIETLGSAVERNALFPQRTNVEFAQIVTDGKIRMRVWERGAGVTMACGSGACATAVAAIRRNLTGRRVEVVLDGGSLHIEWRESDSHVLMTGPAVHVFDGVLKDL